MGLKNCYDKKVGIAVAYEPGGRQDITDAFRCAQAIEKVLQQAKIPVEIFKITKDMLRNISTLETIISEKWLTLYNLFEGFGEDAGEEITFAELVEKLNIPFTGNPSYALRNCLNKFIANKLLSEAGIRTPRSFFIQKECDSDILFKEHGFTPFFIKPCFEDASIGIDEHSLITDKSVVCERIS
jgi:D-alanine-D-alanine ligase